MNLKCVANLSSWQITDEVTCQIDAPRGILWSVETFEGDWTRTGSAAAASPTAQPAGLRLCYRLMKNTISLPRCETPRKNTQPCSIGQEEDQAALPLPAAGIKGSGGLVASRKLAPVYRRVFFLSRKEGGEYIISSDLGVLTSSMPR